MSWFPAWWDYVRLAAGLLIVLLVVYVMISESIKYFKTKGWTKNMNFGEALERVKHGKGMRLPQWNPDVVVRAQYPDKHSKMTAPYLYVESRFGRVPWKETMIELFAEDWEVVD